MALSQSVLEAIDEAQSNLRNALAYAARNERPMVCSSIAEIMSKLESIAKYDELFDSLEQATGKNNDDILTYYRFLYDKNILPVNLSQRKNLKAYAKVIQSFSKAKTLKISGNHASRSLKEFLFEESVSML